MFIVMVDHYLPVFCGAIHAVLQPEEAVRLGRAAAPAAPSGQLFLGDNGIEAVCTSIGFPSGLLGNDTIIRYSFHRKD